MKILNLNGIEYQPLTPQPDSDALCAMGPRLMFRHGSATQPESKIFIAPHYEMNAGWVIGIVEPDKREVPPESPCNCDACQHGDGH